MFISEGDHVVLRRDNCYKFVKIQTERHVSFGRNVFSLKNAIGYPFGTIFEISGSDVEPLHKNSDASFNNYNFSTSHVR